MRRAGLALVLMAAAPAGAQDFTVDAGQVAACLAQTPVGVSDPACLGAAASACQTATPGGETTLGITQCIMAETSAWDALLNREYQATRAQFAQTQGLADQLRDAQRAWIAFRDAECGLVYAIWADGSIRTVVAANCQMEMTSRRTLQLRDMR